MLYIASFGATSKCECVKKLRGVEGESKVLKSYLTSKTPGASLMMTETSGWMNISICRDSVAEEQLSLMVNRRKKSYSAEKLFTKLRRENVWTDKREGRTTFPRASTSVLSCFISIDKLNRLFVAGAACVV